MKRVSMFFAVFVLIVSLAGCGAFQAIQKWTCDNRDVLTQIIQKEQMVVTAIQSTFGQVIPPEYQAVITAAQAAIAQAQNYLDTEVCPTNEDVQNVNTQVAKVNKAMTKARIIGVKK